MNNIKVCTTEQMVMNWMNPFAMKAYENIWKFCIIYIVLLHRRTHILLKAHSLKQQAL